MIELRWRHDPFKELEDISEHAVLVRDKSGEHRPLILQYREKELIKGAHEYPWITVEYVNPKDKS